jgi:hypothetical protein
VLHRNDRGHDERGIFPAGNGVGGAAVPFLVDDPDECERQATEIGIPVLWPTKYATWGRFVVLAQSRWLLGRICATNSAHPAHPVLTKNTAGPAMPR